VPHAALPHSLEHARVAHGDRAIHHALAVGREMIELLDWLRRERPLERPSLPILFTNVATAGGPSANAFSD
jgi:hypothetical protein